MDITTADAATWSYDDVALLDGWRRGDKDAGERLKRSLLPQLMRSEWPSRIRALSIRDMGHK